MKVVVTGGAGFIASHIVDAYIAGGHEVHIIDDLSTGQEKNVNPRATVHRIDIADPRSARLVEEIKPSVLNHHAAQMDVRRSVADPSFDAAVNLVGCIAFGISAIAAFWVPSGGSVLDLAAANFFTALGGLCFLIGAVLLLPLSARQASSAR